MLISVVGSGTGVVITKDAETSGRARYGFSGGQRGRATMLAARFPRARR